MVAAADFKCYASGMKQAGAFVAILLALGPLAGCSKRSDGCSQHTGDGLCADAGKDAQGKLSTGR